MQKKFFMQFMRGHVGFGHAEQGVAQGAPAGAGKVERSNIFGVARQQGRMIEQQREDKNFTWGQRFLTAQ